MSEDLGGVMLSFIALYHLALALAAFGVLVVSTK